MITKMRLLYVGAGYLVGAFLGTVLRYVVKPPELSFAGKVLVDSVGILCISSLIVWAACRDIRDAHKHISDEILNSPISQE